MVYSWLPEAPTCNNRPLVIVPDVPTLTSLAKAGALHLLHRIGYRVVVPDMVAIVATESLVTPYAREIKAWFDAGKVADSPAPVEVAPTWIGRAFAAARREDSKLQWPEGCELAITGWLGDLVYNRVDDILVVYENKRVPDMMQPYSLKRDVESLTVRGFLELAQERGIIVSASEYLDLISPPGTKSGDKHPTQASPIAPLESQ